MFCHKCGREIPTGSQFCPECGSKVIDQTQSTPLNGVEHVHQEPQAAEKTAIRSGPIKFEEGVCPKCGSHDCEIQVQQNVTGSGSNYSAGLGCIGFLLTGPFGLLCGLCGSGSKTITTHQSRWVCKKCGHQFLPRAELAANYRGFVLLLGIIMGLLVPIVALLPIGAVGMVITGDAQVTLQGFLQIVVVMAIPVGICYAIIVAANAGARQNGFQSARDVFTDEEYAACKKTFIYSFLSMPILCAVIFVLTILFS